MKKESIDDIKCCLNCRNCIPIPRNNKYGDIDYLCLVHTYFLHGVKKDITKVKRYSPGGRELECRYERI